jgi:hypothetical protein
MGLETTDMATKVATTARYSGMAASVAMIYE